MKNFEDILLTEIGKGLNKLTILEDTIKTLTLIGEKVVMGVPKETLIEMIELHRERFKNLFNTQLSEVKELNTWSEALK